MTYYPQKPTDWTKGLAEVYDRQSKQLEEHHANLRARDAREVEVKQQESLVKTLAKVAEFSTAARSAVDAHKARKEGKDSEYKGSVIQTLQEHPELLDSIHEDWKAGKKEIWKDSELFGKYMAEKLKDEKYADVNILDRFDGRKQLLLREALAEMMAPKVISDPAYSNFQSKLDPIAFKEVTADKHYRQRWNGEQLQLISNNREFVNEFLFPEASRKNSTNRNIAKARAAAQYNIKEDNLAQGILKVKSGSVNSNSIAVGMVDMIRLETGSGKYKEIEGGPSIQEQATEAVVNKFVQLNLEGHVPQSALTGLDSKLFPAGSIIQAYFAKDGSHLNRIVKANLIGQKKRLGVETAKDKALALDLKRRLLDGEDVTREIQQLKSRNLVSNETIKGLEETDIGANTKEAYDAGKQEWDTIKNDGKFMTKTSLDNAKLIKNDDLNFEIINEQEKLQKSYDANGFDTYEDRHDANTSKIKTNAGDRSPFPGANIGGFDERLADELTNLEAQMYYALWQKEPTSREIGDRVTIQMAALKEQNGFGKKIGEDGAGIWSTDETGELVNYKRSKIGALAIKDNGDNWFKGHMTNWDKIKTTDTPEISMVDNFLNTPGSVLTKEKVLEIIKSKQLTAEFAYKVDLIPGKDETQVLTQITEALLNSDDKTIKEFVKNSNLKNLWEDLITPIKSGEEVVTPLSELIETQTFITDLVDKSGNLDFAGIHKRGLSNASPKQKLRYYNYLQMNSDIQAEKESDAKLAKDAELKRALEYQEQRKKAKEEEDKQAAKAAEILQKNIEGLWTP